jgi:hypothetical protein
MNWESMVFGILLVVMGTAFTFHRGFAEWYFNNMPRGRMWRNAPWIRFVSGPICIAIGLLVLLG